MYFGNNFKDISKNIYTGEITIYHYIYREYKQYIIQNVHHSINEDIEYNKYKEKIINNYKFAEKMNWTKLIDISNVIIVTTMPIYTIIFDNIHLFDILKLKQLIKKTINININFNEWSLKNIGIDKNGNYQLINLDLLTVNKFWKIKFKNEKIILHDGHLLLYNEFKQFNIDKSVYKFIGSNNHNIFDYNLL